MYTFGDSLGSFTGVSAALGVPYMLIRPQAWQCYFGIHSRSKYKHVYKQEIAGLAQRLYLSALLYGPRGDFGDGCGDTLSLIFAQQYLSSSNQDKLIEAHEPKAKKTTTRKKKPSKIGAPSSNTVAL